MSLPQLPLEPPPIIPRLEDELEQFLTNLESLPLHDIDRAQRWDCYLYNKTVKQ